MVANLRIVALDSPTAKLECNQSQEGHARGVGEHVHSPLAIGASCLSLIFDEQDEEVAGNDLSDGGDRENTTEDESELFLVKPLDDAAAQGHIDHTDKSGSAPHHVLVVTGPVNQI